jgi:non-ribosomal peptide synthetase component F
MLDQKTNGKLLKQAWGTFAHPGRTARGPSTPPGPRLTKKTIQGLFEAQVDRHPDRLACTAGAESLTYGELDRRTNQLAHRLRALGVGRDACVAVHLERSLDMLVAILGVLKAGGAYVPLDPEHPDGRHRFTLEDSRSLVLVSRRRLWSGEPPPATARLLCLDEEAAALARLTAERPAGGSGRDAAEPHRSSTAGGATLFIVD